LSKLWSGASKEDADFSDIYDEDEKLDSGLPFGLSLKTFAAGLGISMVVLSGLIYYGLRSKKSTNDDLAPAVTEDEAKQVMQEILDKVKLMATSMLRRAEQIKQQINAQGQEIDDQQLMKLVIAPQLDSSFRELQNEILKSYDMDEEDLEEAVTTYIQEGDIELRDISERIRQIYKGLGGDMGDDSKSTEKGSGKEVTLNDVLQVLNLLLSKSAEKLEDFLSDTKENISAGGKVNMEKLQTAMMKVIEKAETEALAEVGMNTADYQMCLSKNQSSPQIQEAFGRLQMLSQSLMYQYGLI